MKHTTSVQFNLGLYVSFYNRLIWEEREIWKSTLATEYLKCYWEKLAECVTL